MVKTHADAEPKRGQTRKPQDADAEIGRVLREAREARDLNQTALGEHLGISQQQVAKYEKGESSLKVWMMIRMANFLEIEIAELIRAAAGTRPGFAEAAVPYETGGCDGAIVRAKAALKSALSDLEELDGTARRGLRRRR